MAETMLVSFGWRLPVPAGSSSPLLKVTFSAEVIEYQDHKDRWLIRLGRRQSELSADLPDDILSAVEALPGRWVYVPSAARSGLTLPVKLETLTGRIRYFYADDPRGGGQPTSGGPQTAQGSGSP